MQTFITLVNWTDQGVTNMKQSPARIEAFKALCIQQGAELRGFYATMGEYDFVTIVDAPDAAVLAKIVLKVGSMGNVRTKTLPAFDASQFGDIIGSLDTLA